MQIPKIMIPLKCIPWMFSLGVIISSCNSMTQPNTEDMNIGTYYGKLQSDTIRQYELRNAHGMVVKVINYGGIITEILTPDRNGTLGNIVLGYKNLEGYLQEGNPYFGCIVGRYANRIANAQFELNQQTYKLAVNNNGNTLHGGFEGFSRKVWNVLQADSNQITLQYNSPDGEEGYPGNLNTTVVYQLNDQNELSIQYRATSDKATPVNLTQHSYFNLSAGKFPNILTHEVTLHASTFLPVDEGLIPTGQRQDVGGGPMDFRMGKAVGIDMAKVPGGYDHCWILDLPGLRTQATVYEPVSGRIMRMQTTEPGVQFYTGNFLDGSLKHTPFVYGQHAGLCLEAQHFPNSPNQIDFPNTILNPGDVYTQTTIYQFGVQ
jgi:aldose 1-epimerase